MSVLHLSTVASWWLGILGVLIMLLILLNVIYKPVKVYCYAKKPVHVYTSYIFYQC